MAFLVHEFPALTETFILNQIIYLIQSGVDVRIYSLYRGNFNKLHPQYEGFGLEDRLTVVGQVPKSVSGRVLETWRFFLANGIWKGMSPFLKCVNPLRFGSSGLKLTYFLHYLRMAELQSVELVHAHFGQMGAYLARFKSAGLFKNIPYIVSFHGYDLVPSNSVENRTRYKEMFQTAKRFTVNSWYTGRLLEDVEPSLAGKVKHLPESLDTQLFHKGTNRNTDTGNKAFRLVYVGRLVDWKGPDSAIRIAHILVRKLGFTDLELSIIGKGSMLSDLENLIFTMGMTDHVKLLGAQSQQQIRSMLSAADLFVYTGREQEGTRRAENQGLVLMEAQAMGLPVVAFDVGGVSEGILDQATGILVKAGDLQEFAKQVAFILDDSAKRIAMGEAARTFVAANFDIEILGKRLLETYEEVLT